MQRCEICGAPFDATGTVCDLCAVKRISTPSNALGAGDAARSGFKPSFPPREYYEGIEDAGGIVLEGKYRLREEIGRGAMGTVFLAEDNSLKRKVAVKFLLPGLADSVECAERFRNEAIGMAAIRDNNVAQIYAYGVHGKNPYFVMEYLDGQTMENLIDAHNSRGFFIPLSEALDIIIQSVSGLAAIHRSGTIHRDIKPANIMLSGDPVRAVIMDFGLVRNVRVEDEVRILAGTPAYIAPELVEGSVDADRSPLTDVYSMGASAFEILTGSLPFEGESWVEILRKHITEMPPFASERRTGIPDALDEILLKALSKSTKERYQTADEFLMDLIEVKEECELENGERQSYSSISYSTGSWHKAQRLKTTPTFKTKQSSLGSKRRTGRGRLLIADSDPRFRALVQNVAHVVVPGCRVKSATDGAMALRIAEEFRPSVVVIDLALPEVNGFEVIATLRGDTNYQDLAIIVVTEKTSLREVKLLNSLNVREILTKPIDKNTLADILRPALERYIQHYRSTPP